MTETKSVVQRLKDVRRVTVDRGYVKVEYPRLDSKDDCWRHLLKHPPSMVEDYVRRTHSNPWRATHGHLWCWSMRVPKQSDTCWVCKHDPCTCQEDREKEAAMKYEAENAPDWSRTCKSCGATPVHPISGMCGPCTFGEASTAGGEW